MHFLAPVDLSSGLAGISCTLTGHADLADLSRDYVIGLVRTLEYLLSL